MTKIENEISKISGIWKEFNIEGYLNAHKIAMKDISFSPLGNEISIHENTEISCSLNILKDGKKLNIKTEDFTYKNLSKLIEKNLFLLEIGDKDDDNILFHTKENITFDSRKFILNKIKGSFLMKQWEKVKNFKLKDSLSIEGFSYSISEQESYFMNSLGALKIQKANSCNYSYAILYKSADFQDFGYASKYSDFNESISDDFLKDVQDKLLAKSNPKKSSLESGKYNITIRNDMVGEFLDMMMQACKAESIRQNQSFFSKSDIGKTVTSKKITIRSNPKKDDSTFNSLFDSEGISSENISIIENGILKNIFLDSKNARKFKLEPSGNPTYSNLEIIGEQNPDYLKSSSFLLTSFLGMNTTDMTTGKFAMEAEGFEIIDGKIGDFVKNIGFTGNLKDLFLNLDVIGNDVYTYANIFSPSITFKDQMLIF
ncbi:MAG: TldD/PmbA family protein [Candidatus Gracilibacteria bacterium]|nr:TldD/PmbA family protein [Candidatus Gracilibacteria bacterium]